MKIKYTLIYEWEDNETDITSYAKENECSIKNAIKELIEFNTIEMYEKLDSRAANILPVDYKVQFTYSKES